MPWHIQKRDDEWCVVKDADDSVEKCHETEEQAKAHMRALYSSENREEPKIAPIETRAATLAGVDYPARTIDIVAVPYGQEAVVEYRGELWHETFERGAFDGIESRTKPGTKDVKAVRDHDKTRLVGKAVGFSDGPEGLGSSILIAETTLGDETLSLANGGFLSVSAGFAVRNRDQTLNRMTQERRIRRAFLDHVAFVADGAYEGAQIVAVRADERRVEDLQRLDTPRLDEVVAWLESRRKR